MALQRKTRIVCISDTHNCQVKLPAGDVLIHAGDLTNQGSYSELSKTVKWLETTDFEAKIIIAGNHDITLDEDFYKIHGSVFHNQGLQSTSECLGLFKNSPSITYLRHESATIQLKSLSGPRTQFKIFGSPFSPRHGLWAFYYDTPQDIGTIHNGEHQLGSLWDQIPSDTDIVVTHTPAKGHRDHSLEIQRPKGCELLLDALWRVRPCLAVCGHLHEGRGAEVACWSQNKSEGLYSEVGIKQWADPGEGNNKISLVDLTGKSDGLPLRNNSSWTAQSGSVTQTKGNETGKCVSLTRCENRNETCIVNAAIMKSKYPHKGGKQFNKPIVVDLLLPVCED